MSYRHVSDDTVDAPRDLARDRGGAAPSKLFRTWRCGHCRALAITPGEGSEPPAKCGVCHF